jgi:hypothetical protein
MSGRVFEAVRTRDDLFPVKPWAVVCSVAPDRGLPLGRAIHWCWTERGAAGAALYLNALLRDDLLGAEPFARQVGASSPRVGPLADQRVASRGEGSPSPRRNVTRSPQGGGSLGATKGEWPHAA